MTSTVLVLGGTGRTGRAVLEQLLGRGAEARAVVRAADRLPEAVRDSAGLEVFEGDLLALPDEQLRELVDGCDAVVSCLGHNITLHGIYGRPRDLVTQSVARVSRTIQSLRPSVPVKLVLMSSVSVNRPHGGDARRGWLEKGTLALLRGVVPPAKDNQRAADFLCEVVGTEDPHLEWVAVRPDTLLEDEVSEYTVHESLISSIFRPDSTNIANVAHFMCELVENQAAWQTWKNQLPVIVNATTTRSAKGRSA